MRSRFSRFFSFSPKTILGGTFAGGIALAGYAIQHDPDVRSVARKLTESATASMPEFVSDWREAVVRRRLRENDGVGFVPNSLQGKRAVFLRGENHRHVDEESYQPIIDDLFKRGRNPRVVRAADTGPFFRKLRSGYFVVGTKKVVANETVLPYYTSGVVSLTSDMSIAGMFSCGDNPLGLIIIAVPKEFAIPMSRSIYFNKFRAVEDEAGSYQKGQLIYNEQEYIMPRLHGEEIIAVCVVDTSKPGFSITRVHLNEPAMQSHDQELVLDHDALEFIQKLQACDDAGAQQLLAYFSQQHQDASVSNKEIHNNLAAENVAQAYSRAFHDMTRVYNGKSISDPVWVDMMMNPEMDGVSYAPLSMARKPSLDAFIEQSLPTFLQVVRQAYLFSDRMTSEHSEVVLHDLVSSIDPEDHDKIHPLLLDVELSDLLMLEQEMRDAGMNQRAIDRLLGDVLQVYQGVYGEYGQELEQARRYHEKRAALLDLGTGETGNLCPDRIVGLKN